jgi:hypothetical protein
VDGPAGSSNSPVGISSNDVSASKNAGTGPSSRVPSPVLLLRLGGIDLIPTMMIGTIRPSGASSSFCAPGVLDTELEGPSSPATDVRDDSPLTLELAAEPKRNRRTKFMLWLLSSLPALSDLAKALAILPFCRLSRKFSSVPSSLPISRAFRTASGSSPMSDAAVAAAAADRS